MYKVCRLLLNPQIRGNVKIPVPFDIPNIIAVGLNYKDHASELNMPIPNEPVLFFKPTTTLNPHNSPIVLPRLAPDEVDYEAELGVIIKNKCKRTRPEEIMSNILGFTCINDITARDCALRRDRQWARGKGFDSFCCIGPVMETELDPNSCDIKLTLNGKVLQHSNTRNFIWPVAELISYISQNMTLLPHTLILTGTPPGVSYARNPQVYLREGDVISVDIGGIGKLENTVIKEQ
jgi:2-keto-4-pentenoate hydratase/2-oxohepta-3-ene-1,7-dioic acid hydratase in catechol pathway